MQDINSDETIANSDVNSNNSDVNSELTALLANINPEIEKTISEEKSQGLAILESLGLTLAISNTKKVASKLATQSKKEAVKFTSSYSLVAKKSRKYDSTKELSNTNPKYEELTNKQDILSFLSNCLLTHAIGYDIETTGLYVVNNERVLTHQISLTPFTASLIRQEHLLDLDILAKFKELMLSKVIKVIHNFKFEYSFIKFGLNIEIDNYFDTMLAAQYIDENRLFGLKSLAHQEFGVDMIEFEEVTFGTDKYDPDGPYSLEYACADADIALQLYEKYIPSITAGGTPKEMQDMPYANYERLFNQIELPITKVLATMENDGMLINMGLIAQMQEETIPEKARLLKEIQTLANDPNLNPGSDKQLIDLLYTKLKLPTLNQTEKGQPSTNMETLDLLEPHHQIIKPLIEYSHLTQFESLYLVGIPKVYNPITCAVHTQLNQARTVTGRLSSSNPNLQNLRRNQDD